MQKVKQYPEATFSWLDLATNDDEASKSFYTQLFGWDAVDTPMPQGGVYTMLQQNGEDVAGLSQQELPDGHPPYWSSYVSVTDVEASTQKAQTVGATVEAPPFDVMDSGRMSVLRDPTGAFVCLWQAKEHIGASLVNIPNTLCWNELYTRDPEKAAVFYQELFGWDVSEGDGGGEPYWTFTNNGRPAAGMMRMDESWGDVPAYWGIYFAVEDCAASVAKAKELGGTVMSDPIDVPGTGTFAILMDPHGANFNIITMENADPMP